jgi:hypothetical protein
LEIPQPSADVQEVYMGEEVGLVVVEGFLELPLLVGVVVHADNNIGNLCVVADMPAHTLLALQDETGVSVGLFLRHQDNGLLEAVLGWRRGPGLVELRRSLAHKAHLVLTSQNLCVPDQEPLVYVPDHTVPVGCNETTGEPDGAVQLETSDPGDEDLDSGLLVRFLVGDTIPRERGDDAVPGWGSSALGVVGMILAHADLEVHPLTLYSDLAGKEGVPAFLWGDLHALVDSDLERAVMEARKAPTSCDFLCLSDNALCGHYRCVPIGQDNLDLGRPRWVIGVTLSLQFFGSVRLIVCVFNWS